MGTLSKLFLLVVTVLFLHWWYGLWNIMTPVFRLLHGPHHDLPEYIPLRPPSLYELLEDMDNL